MQMQHAEQEELLDRIHEEEPSPDRVAAVAFARRDRKSRCSSAARSPMRIPSPQKTLATEVEHHHQRSFYCEEINGQRVVTEGEAECVEESAPQQHEYAGLDIDYTEEVEHYDEQENIAIGSVNLLQ